MNNVNEGEILLSVCNLCQYFKIGSSIIKAVDGVSFDVRKGEIFGLVGESGCGKTTTGRSIVKLYDITSGEIFFKGVKIAVGKRLTNEKNISAKRKKETRKIYRTEMMRTRNRNIINQIQMIFQDPLASLNPRMTVEEIVAEGLIIGGEKDKKVIEKKVFEALEKVGIPREYAGRYPHEFSGGQRQRIGVARAIITEPELIIADEPVSALDVSVRAQVINLLDRIRKELGLTILFISHDLSVVKYFTDRIGVMYCGKLVEIAPTEKLFSNPLHPYTKSLLSAIPRPDPFAEKRRKRIIYNHLEEDYNGENVTLQEVEKGHLVRCNSDKLAYLLQNTIKNQSEKNKNGN